MINEIACDDFYIITTVNNRRFENKWLINIVEELVYMRANFLMANLSKQKKKQIRINRIACDDFYIISTY